MTLSTEFRRVLEDRYSLGRQIGEGGMATVYLARDRRHQRDVAIKILKPDVAVATERFLEEIRVTANLHHPHVLPLFDSGEADGLLYYVMPYVAGESLRARLRREGPLPLPEALRLTTLLAEAIGYAHRHGVVHRDLKPENILLADGQPLIADFGIALAFSDAAVTRVTAPGLAVGTPQYMSPEQAAGERAIDARTDIYALGAILYEMLTGQPPHSGSSAAAVLAKVLTERPADVRTLRDSVTPALAAVVERALERIPADRWQTAAEFAHALDDARPASATPGSGVTIQPSQPRRHTRGLFVGIAALIVGAAVVSYSYMASRRAKAAQTVAAPTVDAIDSIAVLPFVNESKDPTAEYLSEGISDSIINRLSKLSDLRVASLSSALRYKGQAIDAASAGRDLKVRAVLIGWMTKRGDSLSVRAELVDVHDNRRLWGGNYPNRQLSDLLQVQEDISQRISENLRLHLSGEDQERLEKRETSNSEAYQLYLQGRFYWNKYTEEGFRKSIEYFKEAVEKDPAYALAYAGLADAYSLLGEQSFALPKESFPQARAYAEKALALDETLADAHLSLGIVALFYDWDWPGAEKALRRAKELDPNNPQVYHFYGHYLQVVGRAAEAITETKRGVELDPTSLIINAELGWAYYCARHYDQAIAQDRKTLEFDPNFVYSSWVIAQSYAQTGRHQESLAELKRARTIDANWAYIGAELAYVYATLGERAEAEKILQQLIERHAREHLDAILIAYIYVGLGQKDQAFAWLEKAYQERSGLMPWLKVEPKWDPLRGDARFADLLRRIAH